jgi:hypothetical protein
MSAPIIHPTPYRAGPSPQPFPVQGRHGGWFERHRALEAALVTLGSAVLGAPFLLLAMGGLLAGF